MNAHFYESRNKAEDTSFWSNWVKDCSQCGQTPFSQTCTVCIWLGYLQSCPFKGSMGIFAGKDQTFYKAFSTQIYRCFEKQVKKEAYHILKTFHLGNSYIRANKFVRIMGYFIYGRSLHATARQIYDKY